MVTRVRGEETERAKSEEAKEKKMKQYSEVTDETYLGLTERDVERDGNRS